MLRVFLSRLWKAIRIGRKKVIRSLINLVIVLSLALPFLRLFNLLESDFIRLRILCIAMFFIYNAGCELRYGRCVGMMVFPPKKGNGYYIGQPGATRRLCFAFFYTIFFGISLFWILFPGDLLLINIGFQLICVRIRKNTIHASLAGVKIDDDEEIVERKAA